MDKIFSPIKGRIFEYLNSQGIKKELFYENTGITSSNFKGKGAISEIGGDKIAKILTMYPHLSARWLILGEGPMIIDQEYAPVVSDAELKYKKRCSLCDEKERVIKAKDELIESLKRELYLITGLKNGHNSQTG